MSEQRATSADESDLIEDLVVRFLERHESDGALALDALCHEHPAHAGALRVRIETLREAGLIEDAGAPRRDFPERLGDFRLLARLGGGAMGVVYLAQQESLGREVALKLIKPELLYFPGARERFGREIEAIARLQHPGVVPIYTVGEASGIPYFAMERVRGCTLADVIESLAGREVRTLSGADFDRAIAQRTGDDEQHALAPIFDGTWVDASVRIVREAAEALEHVHRRGVLHRDLKPSNVMVTRGGRVMLVDFGLASAQGGDRMTRTGSQLGSLAYMAPEQVRGEFKEADARSDVYSLGVVLYELLALELPFDGDSPTTVRRRVEAGQPPSIRGRNSDVDWDVETVCLTAMERDRARRYASAADFAHDLTNLLEHRPIAARRAGVALRVRRWAQRHPAAGVAIVLGGALLVGGPALFGWQQRARSLEVARKNAEIEGKNRELQTAFDTERDLRAESDAQRARAERNFAAALESVRTMLKDVGAHELDNAPEMEETRRKLLEKALAFYQGFVRDAGDSPALQAELAQTQRYIGDVTFDLNRLDDSSAAYRASIAAFRRLREQQPARVQHINSLSNTLAAFARVLAEEGQFDETTATIDEAVELARAALERDPEALPLRVDLARAVRWQAWMANHVGRVGDAERGLEETLSICRDSEGKSSTDTDLLDVEGAALATLGLLQYYDRRLDPARATFARAVEIRQAAYDRDASDRWARVELAEALTNLGMSWWSAPDPSTAEHAYLRALEVQETLVRDFPRTAYYRHGLSSVAQNLGVLLHQRRRDLAAAEPHLRRAVEVLEPLLAERPDAAEYRYSMGGALASLAAVERDQGRLDAAAATVDRALDSERKALAINPGNPGYVEHIRSDLFIAADVHLARGSYAEAAARAREAITHGADDWTTLALAATRFAACVPLAENDAALDDAQRAQVAEGYTGESLDALQAAVDTGHAKWDEFAGSHYLDPVRMHERFAAIEELARKRVE